MFRLHTVVVIATISWWHKQQLRDLRIVEESQMQYLNDFPNNILWFFLRYTNLLGIPYISLPQYGEGFVKGFSDFRNLEETAVFK